MDHKHIWMINNKNCVATGLCACRFVCVCVCVFQCVYMCVFVCLFVCMGAYTFCVRVHSTGAWKIGKARNVCYFKFFWLRTRLVLLIAKNVCIYTGAKILVGLNELFSVAANLCLCQ